MVTYIPTPRVSGTPAAPSALTAAVKVKDPIKQLKLASKECIACQKSGWAKCDIAQQVRCPDCQTAWAGRASRHISKRARKTERQANAVATAEKKAPPAVVWDITGQAQPDELTVTQLDSVLQYAVSCHNKHTEQQRNGVMQLQGSLLEMFIPTEDKDASSQAVNEYKCWEAITGTRTGTPAWRGPRPTQAIDFILEAVKGTHQAFQRYFGATPFVHHDIGLIGGDLHQGKGDKKGQPMHCDVDSPEAFAITYLLPGLATTVAKYTPEEHADFMDDYGLKTGYTPAYLTMHPGGQSLLYASYMSSSLLAAPDLMDKLEKSDGSTMIPSCAVNIVRGGIPHGAHGLTDFCPKRLIIFSAATPLRTCSPYGGYEQKLVGECELFWACCAKNEKQRVDFVDLAKTALVRNVEYYKTYFGGKVYNGPIVKLVLALVQAQNDALDQCKVLGPVTGQGCVRAVEVGFSVAELQRAHDTVSGVILFACRAPQLKSLKWLKGDTSEIMGALKEVITRTKAVEEERARYKAWEAKSK